MADIENKQKSMANAKLHKILTVGIAFVWIINGLICKALNWVPRHEQIVARILSEENSRLLIVLIGLSEIGIAIWLLSGIGKKLNTIVQIVTVATMNFLEILFVPDLLLWGRLNIVFAFIFITVVYYNGFKLIGKPVYQL